MSFLAGNKGFLYLEDDTTLQVSSWKLCRDMTGECVVKGIAPAAILGSECDFQFGVIEGKLLVLAADVAPMSNSTQLNWMRLDEKKTSQCGGVHEDIEQADSKEQHS
jgi:hypothetical protein